ncbi:hypothetical protein GCM10023100_53310 [Actinocorallia cavernae]|uniref:Uncharacterized protein n=2 Tax=Actinomycetes TaxID=1760 RepID=A0ABP8T2Z2_9ACTN
MTQVTQVTQVTQGDAEMGRLRHPCLRRSPAVLGARVTQVTQRFLLRKKEAGFCGGAVRLRA